MAEISGCSRTITQLTQITGCTDFDSSFLLIGVDATYGETKSITADLLFDCLDTFCYWTGGTGYGSIMQPNEDGQNNASGRFSLAEGGNNIASGYYAHAEGGYEGGNIASGNNSHAEGGSNVASGVASHAEGAANVSSGDYSHTEGGGESGGNIASGNFSHAEGSDNISIGVASHTEGQGVIASGDNSHAGGLSSKASGDTSFVHSTGSNAYGDYSAILGGQNNILESSATNSAIIGGNNISGVTSNTVYVPKIEIKETWGGIIITTSGGTRYNLKIDDTGNLYPTLL